MLLSKHQRQQLFYELSPTYIEFRRIFTRYFSCMHRDRKSCSKTALIRAIRKEKKRKFQFRSFFFLLAQIQLMPYDGENKVEQYRTELVCFWHETWSIKQTSTISSESMLCSGRILPEVFSGIVIGNGWLFSQRPDKAASTRARQLDRINSPSVMTRQDAKIGRRRAAATEWCIDYQCCCFSCYCFCLCLCSVLFASDSAVVTIAILSRGWGTKDISLESGNYFSVKIFIQTTNRNGYTV